VKIVAVIPARGGSKGIPRKNLRKVGSNSLLVNRILEARKSTCNDVFVSTEDREIAEEAISFGAQIIRRPESLSQDETSTDAVLLHAVEELQLKDDDVLVLLQATSPFLSFKRIDLCIEELINRPTANSAITLRIGHPFMWSLHKDTYEPHGHTRDKRPRRQELGVEGWETGGCYAIRVSALKLQKVRYPSPTLGISVNHLEALDIDTQEDLELAMHIMQSIEGFNKTKGGNRG
jgi:CMP-N-acetylneuraminic acid synthetase